jgi:hypothetical protein
MFILYNGNGSGSQAARLVSRIHNAQWSIVRGQAARAIRPYLLIAVNPTLMLPAAIVALPLKPFPNTGVSTSANVGSNRFPHCQGAA